MCSRPRILEDIVSSNLNNAGYYTQLLYKIMSSYCEILARINRVFSTSTAAYKTVLTYINFVSYQVSGINYLNKTSSKYEKLYKYKEKLVDYHVNNVTM